MTRSPLAAIALLVFARVVLAAPPTATARIVFSDGAPFANQRVRVECSNATPRPAMTDADGRLVVSTEGLGAPLHLSVLESPPCGIDLPDGGGDWGTIYVPRPAIVIGRLLGADGRPTRGKVRQVSPYDEPFVESDADGRFRLEVWPGDAEIWWDDLPAGWPQMWDLRTEAGRVYSVTMSASPAVLARVAMPGRGGRFELVCEDPAEGVAFPAGWCRSVGEPDADGLRWVAPGRYRLLEQTPGSLRGSERHVVLDARSNELAPISPTAIPCVVVMENAEVDPGQIKTFTYRREPPALEARAFRRWPLDRNFQEDGSISSSPADPALDEGSREFPESTSARIIYFYEPGDYGITVQAADGASGRARILVGTKPVRATVRLSSDGGALVMRRSLKRIAGISVGEPEYAILVGPDESVVWASGFTRSADIGAPARPPEPPWTPVRGLPTGRHELRYKCGGFPPRSVRVDLAPGNVVDVVLEPF